MVCCFHSECTSVNGCLYSLCRVNNSHTGNHTHTHAVLKLYLLVGILSYHTLHMYVFSNVVLRLCLCAHNHTSGKSIDCYKIVARRFFKKKKKPLSCRSEYFMQYDSQEIRTNVKEMSCTIHIKHRNKKKIFIYLSKYWLFLMYMNNFVDHWYEFS